MPPWSAVLSDGQLQAAVDDPSLAGKSVRQIRQAAGFCEDLRGQLEWSIQLDHLPGPYRGPAPEERTPAGRGPGAIALERLLIRHLGRRGLDLDIKDVYHQAYHPDRGFLRLRAWD